MYLTFQQIADVVVHWNVNETYHREKRNCQHFIDDICNAIGIKLEFGYVMFNHNLT